MRTHQYTRDYLLSLWLCAKPRRLSFALLADGTGWTIKICGKFEHYQDLNLVIERIVTKYLAAGMTLPEPV